ncbi:hypothetical protein T492DRAFT_865099 [Pavlovales sp. CCMP2436]|nr:hypothetical protein T492DRAFT_865099 [Pavlovales sp. CCMP2436]
MAGESHGPPGPSFWRPRTAYVEHAGSASLSELAPRKHDGRGASTAAQRAPLRKSAGRPLPGCEDVETVVESAAERRQQYTS